MKISFLSNNFHTFFPLPISHGQGEECAKGRKNDIRTPVPSDHEASREADEMYLSSHAPSIKTLNVKGGGAQSCPLPYRETSAANQSSSVDSISPDETPKDTSDEKTQCHLSTDYSQAQTEDCYPPQIGRNIRPQKRGYLKKSEADIYKTNCHSYLPR